MKEERAKNQTNKKKKTWRKVFFGSVCFLLCAAPAMAQINTSYEGIALSDRSPVEIVLYLLSWVLGILALIAVVIVLYGGFVWMTAAGNEEKIDKAKKILRNALIGLLIVLSAWGIVLYFLGVFGEATGTGFTGGEDGTCTGCWGGGSSGSSFYVSATEPGAEDTDVSLCTAIQATTTYNVDQSTVTADNFYLQIDGGRGGGYSGCTANNECSSGVCESSVCVGDNVAGTIAFGPGDSTNVFSLILDEDMESSTTYHAYILGGASGVLSEDDSDDGIDNRLSMTQYDWYFTTGTSTDVIPPTVQENSSSPFPADGEIDVCTNTVINFDFSEPMLASSFNDDVAFVLDSAGTDASPVALDWVDPLALDGWTFGASYDYAQVRPAEQLDDNTYYGTRLYGGDPDADFANSVTDMCGNPLDGDADGTAEGDTVDNYLGYDADAGDTEEPIVWETGENAECTPVVESVSPGSDYYGEYAGLRDGEACSSGADCASGTCGSGGTCEGYGDTTLTITGLYLTPHPEVTMDGSLILASEDYNTCFNENHLGNLSHNTSQGDYCLDEDLQSTAEIVMRTPVGAGDTSVTVSVAGESSEPSEDEVEILSPYIEWIDPDSAAVGSYITVRGENFGTDTGTVYMRSTDGRRTELELPTACDDVWSSEEIVAIVPEAWTNIVTGATGSWETGDIAYIQVVHADSSTSRPLYSDLQTFTFTDVTSPNLCEIAPSCHESGGQSFTASGDNFGESQGADDLFVFTSESDETTGYYGQSLVWADLEISGTTESAMGQDGYYVTVYDGDTGLSSNGRSYDIPCSEAPNVVDISSCDQDAGIYPVPNPRPDDTDACLNSTVGILFDQEMSASSFTSDTVYLEQYNESGDFDSSTTPVSVDGHFDTTSWTVVSGDNTYYGFKYNIDTTYGVDSGALDGSSSSYLQADTWYQLTITTGVESTEGVNMADTYTMQFKADDTDELCEVSTIEVEPESATLNSYYSGSDRNYQSYNGTPYDADCNLLDSSSYLWDWIIDNTSIGDFGSGSASVSGGSDTEEVYVAGSTVVNEGTATVTADVEGIADDALFTVDLGYCETNDDCTDTCTGSTCNEETSHCTPVITDFSPSSGDHGTWVTINGCMFGSAKGTVYWNSSDDSISADTGWPRNANCEDTWSSTQIIAEVPERYDSDGNGTVDTSDDELPDTTTGDGLYNIEVETQYGDSSESSSTYELNETTRPGLCIIEPDSAEELETVTAYGQGLGSDEGLASFLSDDDYSGDSVPDRISADADHTTWTDEDVATRVAIGAVTGLSATGGGSCADGVDCASGTCTADGVCAGQDGFVAITSGATDDQCTDDSYCSNPLDFVVSCNSDYDCGSGCCSDSGLCTDAGYCATCEEDGDCNDCGDGLSSCEAGICTPVISNLDPEYGPNTQSVTIQGCYFGSYLDGASSVTFDTVEAALLCTDTGGWSSSEIIVAVPDETADGLLAIGSTAEVNVTTEDSLTTETGADFEITEQCSGVDIPADGVPVLCSLNPGTGTPASEDGSTSGTSVTFTGENFVETGQENLFSGAEGEDDIAGNNFTYLDAEETSAEVPYGTATGNASVAVDSCSSNGLEFGAECETTEDCAEGYCVDGLCTTDSCGGCTPSDDTCGTTQGCYWDSTYGSAGDYCCAAYPQLTEASVEDGATDVCPNAAFTYAFSEAMETADGADAIRLHEYDLDSESTVSSIDVAVTWDTDGTTATLTPDSILDTDTAYRLRVRSDDSYTSDTMRSDATDLYLLNGTQDIFFTTASNICVPEEVVLINDDTEEEGNYTFTEASSTTNFTANVYSAGGQLLARTDEIDWEYTWDPYYDEARCNNVAWIDSDESVQADAASQPVVSGTENDESDTLTVTITDSGTESWTDYGATATVLEGTANLYTFFCAEDEVWEYVDESTDSSFVSHSYPQHFRLIYCQDETLPELDNIVVNEGGSTDDWFLQYLFINSDDEDVAFGVRTYSNSTNLTPEQWYTENVPEPGSPGTTTIDGYEAVQDGYSYYVAVSNIDDDTDSDGLDELYNNIYLFTFNDNDELLTIADDILEFLRFNLNVDYEDCEGSDKNRLVRDTKRVNDLGTIASLANEYYDTVGEYPEPQSSDFGSYIQELTTSVWNSWQGALGNLFGTTLPEDTYNFFYAVAGDTADPVEPWEIGSTDTPWLSDDDTVDDCPYDADNDIYFDEEGTCWDPINSEFFCPENSFIYAWSRTAADDAYLYATLEFDGGSASEDYIDFYGYSDDPCTSVTETAECECFNAGMTSESAPGEDWTAIP
ncbi:Mbov_0395 family pilin-like conjugal transfer protein [Patescibacteria group bacterium]